MTTKYAKAKDTALQWRAEYRKVKEENKTLRRVLVAALKYIAGTAIPHTASAEAALRASLVESTKRAVLAIEGD